MRRSLPFFTGKFFDACSFANARPRAVDAFHKLYRKHHRFDQNAYHSYLECLGRLDDWNGVFSFLELMREDPDLLSQPSTSDWTEPRATVVTLRIVLSLARARERFWTDRLGRRKEGETRKEAVDRERAAEEEQEKAEFKKDPERLRAIGKEAEGVIRERFPEMVDEVVGSMDGFGRWKKNRVKKDKGV